MLPSRFSKIVPTALAQAFLLAAIPVFGRGEKPVVEDAPRPTATFKLQDFVNELSPPSVADLIKSFEASVPLDETVGFGGSGIRLSAEQKSATEFELKIIRARERGDYESALGQANEYLKVCQAMASQEAWRVKGASLLVEELQQIVGMSPEARAESAKCDQQEPALETLQDEGKYAQAIELATGLLELRSRLFGKNSLAVSKTLNQLGEWLRADGKYAEGEMCYKAAVTMRRRLLGDDHPAVAASLTGLAQVMKARGDHASAEALYRRSLCTFRNQVRGAHVDFAATMNHFAVLLRDKGELAWSEALFRDALEMRREVYGPEHVEVSKSLHNLASLFIAKGDYQAAEPLDREGLAMRRRILGDRHPLVATSLFHVANQRFTCGDYNGAEPLFREALEIRRVTLGADHPDIAQSLNSLAVLKKVKGDYASAEPLYREALALRRKQLGTEHPRVADSLLNLANVLADKGDFGGAEPLYRESLEMRRKLLGADHPELAKTMFNVAIFFRATGETTESIQLQTEALAIFRKKFGEEHPDVASSLFQLARTLKEKGDYAQAEEFVRQSLVQCRKLLGADHPYTAGALSVAGSLAKHRGELSEAEALFQEAVAIQRRVLGEQHWEVAKSLEYLGDLASLRGDFAAADSFLAESLTIAEKQRTQVVGSERERAMFADRLRLPTIAAKRASVLAQLGKPGDAVTVLERGRGRALLDLLDRSHRDLIDEVRAQTGSGTAEKLNVALQTEDVARTTLVTIENKITATQRRKDLTKDAREVLQGQQALELQRAKRELADAESAVVTELRAVWPDAQPATDVEIRKELNADEVVLSYAISEEAVLVAVIPSSDRGDVKVRTLVAGKDEVLELNKRVNSLRKSVAAFPGAGESLESWQKAANELSQHLFPKGVQDEIVTAKRLVVLPDGALGDIPIEVLFAERGKSSDSRPQVVYAESATVYARRRQENRQRRVSPESQRAALVVGDPLFDRGVVRRATSDAAVALADLPNSTLRGGADSSALMNQLDQVRLYGKSLVSLPGTEHEAKSIAERINATGGEARLLVGEEATVGRIESAVTDCRFVHFATHGLTGSRDRPYDASLALTQPETATSDDIGFLTLDRLIRKWRGKLSKCELVVLSACDTQRGVAAGGGVMALPWGFMYAGAPTVVASLWQVDDDATTLLMTRFYENLLGAFAEQRTVGQKTYRPGEPIPKSDSLHEAQDWLQSLDRTEVIRLTRPDPKKEHVAMARGTIGTVRSTTDLDHPYAHPYFWAAFVLLGDPD